MEGIKDKKVQPFTQLIEEVEEVFGRRVSSSRDCIQLSEEIYFRTSFRINPNTLRRFFGLVKADYPPSAGTLGILSKYCGFDTLDDLLASKQARKGLVHSEAKTLLDYLVNLFRTTNVRSMNDETFLALVRQTIQFLQQQPQLIDKFQRAIARTKNGQEYYFEQFVNIDRLNSYYGEGLRYYLMEKQTPDAQIFGYSLLCQKAWLSNDGHALKKYFDELSRQKMPRNAHPFICGRFFASHIFYADLHGLNPERILIDAQQAHSNLHPFKDNYGMFPCFEYVFTIALVLTGHYQEALYYMDYAEKNYSGKHSYIDQGYYKTMQLIQGIALARLQEKEQAESIYRQIRPSQFYFLTKKTNTILYILLAGLIKKKNATMDHQLATLVQETGFKKLEQFK